MTSQRSVLRKWFSVTVAFGNTEVIDGLRASESW